MALFGSIAALRAQAPQTPGFRIAFTYVEEVMRPGSGLMSRIRGIGRGDAQKIELGSGVFAIEQVYETKPRAEGFFESHRKYIDVQVMVEGEELMEVVDLAAIAVNQAYREERDLITYQDAANASQLRLIAGQAAIFTPVDVHMPTLRLGATAVLVRKTVVRFPSPDRSRSAPDMNYRHHFHAGNYADVMKHALLVQLVRGLQRKEKGFLYLDTHAGRGRYDLETAAAGDSLARRPEWPDGIGRLWSRQDAAPPAGVTDYLELIRAFDQKAGNLDVTPRFYPGSPLIVQMLARPVDRLAWCEKHPEEFSALQTEFRRSARTSLHESDGYAALRAMLPPPERRALVLIDPPFEAQDEFSQITTAIASGLKRFSSGVFAVWYPLTVRARVDEFLRGIFELNPPPTVALELAIAGEFSALKMKGCGFLVINPPWQFEASAMPVLDYLAAVLAQDPGSAARINWIVREAAT